MTATLTVLSLANNQLDAEASSALAAWLANPNGVRELDLSNTNANLEVIFPAIVRGCPELRQLKISGNKLTPKAITHLASYLQSTTNMNTLNISSTSISVDGLKEILKAIGGNCYLQEFDLNLAENKLGQAGATMLANIGDVKNLAVLNLSDNDFGDEGITVLANGLASHPSIKTLDLSRNFSLKPTKSRENSVESLATLISGEIPLTCLILQGSKNNALKSDILSFLYAIGTNSTLLYLDISGHQMGVKGGIALGKALQTNTKLSTLLWDDNGTPLAGFANFKIGLERNRTLANMPLPILDISNAIRTEDVNGQKKLTSIVTAIQECISLNKSPMSRMKGGQKGVQNTFGQLQILSSGAREQIERLRYKIKSTAREMAPDQKLVISDAENNDSSIASLHLQAEAFQGGASDEIQAKMKSFASELAPLIRKHFMSLVSEVVNIVQDKYKSLDSDTIRLIKQNVTYGVQEVEVQTIEKIMQESAFAEITNKVNESFMAAVGVSTDYIYEKLAQSLQEIIDDVRTEKHVSTPAPTYSAPATPSTPTHSTPSPSPSPSPAPTTPAPTPSTPAPSLVVSAPASSASPPSNPAPATPNKISIASGRAAQPATPTQPLTASAGSAGSGGTSAPASPNVAQKPLTKPAAPAPGSASPSEERKPVGRGVGGLAGRGLAIDPSKMAPGRGAPLRPATAAKPAEEQPQPSQPSPKPAPSPRTTVNKPAAKPAPKKPGATSGDTALLDAAPAVESNITSHPTKDRPMVKANRRPPTRRPRGPEGPP